MDGYVLLVALLIPHAEDFAFPAAMKINAFAALAMPFASSFRTGAVCFITIGHYTTSQS
jgi:hypothetical protein